MGGAFLGLMKILQDPERILKPLRDALNGVINFYNNFLRHVINVRKTLSYNINFHNGLDNIENGDVLILDEKIKKLDPEKFRSFLRTICQ